MNGVTKLKVAILILFLLMAVAIVFSWVIVTIEENATIDEYEDLSYDDQQVLTRFYDRLPDYSNAYMIIGFLTYAVTIGLFLLLFRLWNMKNV